MRNLLALVAVLAIPSLAWAQNQPPVAEAGPDMSVIVNQSFQLDGTASYDPDGDAIVYWSWQTVAAPAGAASPLKDTYTSTPLFTGTVAGDYIISLAVFDGQFWSAPDFVIVSVVQNQPPVAIIAATPTSGTAPLTVQFDGTQSYDPEGAAVQFYWRLGDGSVSASPTVSQTYIMPGTYVADLTVTDALGAQDQATVEITVSPAANHAPVASPTVTPSAGEAPLAVQFAANASDPDGDPLTYAWTFGDGAASTDPNPTHTYTQAGNYVAWLTVSDGQASFSASFVIAISSNLVMSVTSARIDYVGPTSTLASFSVAAGFDGLAPTGDDVIAMSADGVSLFAAPFSSFVPAKNANEWDAGATNPLLYKLRLGNDLRVWLDLGNNTILVTGKKLNFAGIDLANGLDVQLAIGQTIAVDNVTLTGKPGRKYVYEAP